jgi:hypothetical protein
MATRLTQAARETLAAGGSPNVRITQAAREVLTGGSPNVRVTQIAVETLVFIGAAVAAEVRESQAALEYAGRNPPATTINETQEALEHAQYPPNAIWGTQVCLEVALPAEVAPPTGARNYLYTGVWART